MVDSWKMDYDLAENHWLEKDKESVHMAPDELRERIERFIGEHNTCALATASGDFVRCTPIEYNYIDGVFYLFSEGGLKFRALRDNKNVGFAIYEPYDGFNKLKSLQVMGVADMVEPFSEVYMMMLDYKKIPVDAIKKMPQPMNLIKIMPESYDYLDSDLKKDGVGIRQHLDME